MNTPHVFDDDDGECETRLLRQCSYTRFFGTDVPVCCDAPPVFSDRWSHAIATRAATPYSWMFIRGAAESSENRFSCAGPKVWCSGGLRAL